MFFPGELDKSSTGQRKGFPESSPISLLRRVCLEEMDNEMPQILLRCTLFMFILVGQSAKSDNI